MAAGAVGRLPVVFWPDEQIPEFVENLAIEDSFQGRTIEADHASAGGSPRKRKRDGAAVGVQRHREVAEVDADEAGDVDDEDEAPAEPEVDDALRAKRRRTVVSGASRVVADIERLEASAEPGRGETYFSLYSKASKTSNHTLATAPTITEEESRSLVQGKAVRHAKEKKRLHTFYESQFPQWHVQLRNGFNLLFHGYGSKKDLLQRFGRYCFNDGPTVVVNGYSASFQIKQLLNRLTTDCLKCTDTFRTPLDHARFIRDAMSPEGVKDALDKPVVPPKCIYVILHAIDAPIMRHEKTQLVLAELAAVNNLHMIASMDNNGDLMWDWALKHRFNFLYTETPTFVPYTREMADEMTLLGQGGEMRVTGVLYVLGQLTPNARQLFKLLVAYQLAHPEERGMPSTELYNQCRQNFCVSSEANFQQQLVEFHDHRIIDRRTLPDGADCFHAPFAADKLRTIVEQMKAR